MCRVVSLEALQDISMSNDARARNSFGVGLPIEKFCPPGMVDVAVSINDGVNGTLIPAAQSGERQARGLPASRIHEHQPFGGAESCRVSEQIAGMDGDC